MQLREFSQHARAVLLEIASYESSDSEGVPPPALDIAKREIHKMMVDARAQTLPGKKRRTLMLARLVQDQWPPATDCPQAHSLGKAITALEDDFAKLAS